MADLKVLEAVDDFLDVLKQSGLVTEEAWRELRSLADDGKFRSARDVARHLIDADLATPWQVKRLLVGVTNLRLGRYLLYDQLAEHELGRVFRARHEALDREVALKVFHRRSAQETAELEQLLDQCRHIAQFDHRNLVHVLDVEEERGRVFLVMEYVPGSNLSQCVDEQGTLPLHQAIDILRQTAAGLAYLHHQDFAHGDLHPESILVDQIGHVRLAGIGVAGMLAQKTGTTVNSYEAPERAVDKVPATPQSDVYSLGAVAYFLLTGKPPEELAPTSTSDGSAPRRQLPPLRSLLPDAPATLERTLKRMTAHLPEDRYSDAQVLVHLFEDMLDEVRESLPDTVGVTPHETTAAEALALPEPTGDAAQDDGEAEAPGHLPMPPWMMATAAGLLLALVAGALWWWSRSGDDNAVVHRDTPPAGQLPPSDATPKESKQSNKSDQQKSAEWVSPFQPIDPAGATPAGAEPAAPSGNGTGTAAATATSPQTNNDPAGTASDKAAPKSNAPATTETTETVKNDGKPTPADQSTSMKEPAVSPDPAPRTVAKKPPPKKPAPRAGFAQLPKVVALPLPQDGSDPFDIGPIDIGPQELVIMRIEGSEQATRGTDRFVIENAQGGTELHRWDVFIVRGTQRVPTAQLAVDHGRLLFQWLPAAEREREAPALANTVLSLVLGTKTHRIVLRKPVTVALLPVQLGRSSTTEKWKIPNLPNPAAIRCRIRGLVGGFPKEVAYDPGQEITLARKSVRIMIGGKEPEQSPFVLQLSLKSSRTTISATVNPKLRIPPSTKLERFTPKRFRDLTTAVSRRQEQIVAEMNRIKARIKAIQSNRGLDVKQKKSQTDQLRQGLNLLEQDLEKISGLAETLTGLEQSFSALPAGSGIDLELFLLVGKTRIVVLQTAAAPNGGKPAGK